MAFFCSVWWFPETARSRKQPIFRPHLEQLESRETPAVLPDGFTESLVASGLFKPTAMELAPDGRLFVAEQTGALRIIKDGQLLGTPFVTLAPDTTIERGLLGIALDPEFEANHFVYVYYTAKTPQIHNRVSRFTADGDTALSDSEVPILDLNNVTTYMHNGGAIHFGSDGKLYIAVGDDGVGSNAQSMDNLLGKMLRLNPDGSIPSDNPFVSTATGLNQAIWALGLRNPYTFAVQPDTGRIFINDVGEATDEEIDLGQAGANYGWPATEGPTTDAQFVSPIYSYTHGGDEFQGNAIVGGTFYDPELAQFPNSYIGDYFFSDFVKGWIHRFDPTSGEVTTFASGIKSPVDLKVDADGALYYLSRGAGSVFRVSFTPPPKSDSMLFVAGLYRDVLDRDGDAEGVQGYQQSLNASRLPLFLTVAKNFLSSTEYRARQVSGLYLDYLGRPGSSSEVDQWIEQFEQGQATEQVTATFLGSDEYFALNSFSNPLWMKSVYNALFDRDPDEAGLDFFLQQLDAGLSRQMVAQTLLGSTEYQNRLVNSFYQTYLGRPAQDTEINFWVTQLQQSATDEEVQDALLGSDEYVQLYGNNGPLWITSLYQALLHREPDAGGLNSYTTYFLENGSQSRQDLATAFVTSPEARLREVTGLYTGLLGRSPSDSEVAGWVDQRQSGLTAEQLQSIFLGSPEYFQRQGGDNADWLRSVYQATLGRNPDGDGQAHFLGQLTNGLSRQMVALTLLQSTEYRTQLVASMFVTYLHRTASSDDITALVTYLQQGHTQEQLEGEFLTSNEYFLRQQDLA